MIGGQLRITVRVEYDTTWDGTVTSERTMVGSSGNPRCAPKEAADLLENALCDVVAALAAVTGDIREQGAAL